jgi:hypothetical protein
MRSTSHPSGAVHNTFNTSAGSNSPYTRLDNTRRVSSAASPNGFNTRHAIPQATSAAA